jgi:GT2 family glycosyltransferase
MVQDHFEEPAMRPLISAIIPVYGESPTLQRCLDSLRGQVDQIIIVDDGSDTFDEGVRDGVICTVSKASNDGFSAACNFGARSASWMSEYLIFVNSDVQVFPTTVGEMVKCADSTTIVGAKLLYPGSQGIQHGGVYWMGPQVVAHAYHSEHQLYAPACAVRESLVTGGLMLVPCSLFHELGGFDEQFHMAYEDIDLQMRAYSMGARAVYCGKAEALHYEGATRKDTNFSAAEVARWNQWESDGQRLFYERYRGFDKSKFRHPDEMDKLKRGSDR